jgi:peptide/nickel transport system permease protein
MQTLASRVDGDAPGMSLGAPSPWRAALRNKVVLAGTAVALLIVVAAIGAPWLARVDPEAQNFELLESPPSRQAWFGTDRFGRDIYARVVFGARISLTVASLSMALAMLVGGTLGLVSGYVGGWWDLGINRVLDVGFAIPGLLLSIGIAAMRGPGTASAIIAIAIVYTPQFARVMRGPVLAERQRDYVEAGRALGAGAPRLVVRHVLPNVIAPFVVQGTVGFSQAILIEASLSYLGLGAQPPTPSWGTMLSEGRDYLEAAPWMSIFPGLAIMLTVLAFNLLGDGLRDILDPKARRGLG